MPILVSYNKNDFYYNTSGLTPSNEECKLIMQNKDELDKICCVSELDKSKCSNWDENVEKCYKYELCKNKNMAVLANTLENNNSGNKERHENLSKQYQNELIKSVNFSFSIAIIAYLSVYFFKP